MGLYSPLAIAALAVATAWDKLTGRSRPTYQDGAVRMQPQSSQEDEWRRPAKAQPTKDEGTMRTITAKPQAKHPSEEPDRRSAPSAEPPRDDELETQSSPMPR